MRRERKKGREEEKMREIEQDAVQKRRKVQEWQKLGQMENIIKINCEKFLKKQEKMIRTLSFGVVVQDSHQRTDNV